MKQFRLTGIVIGLMLLSAALVWAQTATVMGRVTDRTNKPVVKATVSIGEKFAFTDLNGRYRIKDVLFGRFTLRIKKKGRVLHEALVEINQAQKTMNVQVP